MIKHARLYRRLISALGEHFIRHKIGKSEEGVKLIPAGDEAAVVVSGRRDTPNEVDDSLHPHLLNDVEDV